MERIHIVGVSSRTGTTLLAKCMRACFEIDSASSHERQLRKLRWGDNIEISNNPIDIYYCYIRMIIDPRLNVICMMRDPRDIITISHNDYADKYQVPLNTWKSRVKYMDKLLFHPRFMLIRYEDFTNHPNKVQRQIEKRLPYLQKKAEFTHLYKSDSASTASLSPLNDLGPIDSGRIGIWRNHRARVAKQIHQYGSITQELIEFGYETDEKWIQSLNDEFNGVTADRPRFQKEPRKNHIRTWLMSLLSALICRASYMLRRPLG